jgi:hypothetical protein
VRRRHLLAALTAGAGALAGCSTFGGSSDGPETATETPSHRATPTDRPPTGTDTPTATSTEPPGDGEGLGDLGTASIVDLQTVSRTYSLTPLQYRSDDGAAVRMRFASTATADGPATVEATLRNANDFANTFRLEWTPPFGRLRSQNPHPLGARHAGDHSYEVGLVFAPTPNHDLVDDPPDVERAEDGHWRLAGSQFPEFPERTRLEPDETVSGEYALVGRKSGVGDGRPSGAYEFVRADARNLRVTVWETESPGPDEQSRFAGASVPPLPIETETAWFHEADSNTPTFVRPAVEQTALPARVEFTFVNRSREATSCGHWNLYKLRDARWFHVGPAVHSLGCRSVAPGGATRWPFRMANDAMAPARGDGHAFPFLGGGRYAAVAGYGHATHQSGALFDVDAPTVDVGPTQDVTTERESDIVTATSERWRKAPKSESRTRTELALERGGRAEHRFIPEQVMQRRNRGLRNTLALASSDVERVVLRTDDSTASRAVGYGDSALRFWYGGEEYVLTKQAT